MLGAELVHRQPERLLIIEEADSGDAAGPGTKNYRSILMRDAAERDERKGLKGVDCLAEFFEADGRPVGSFGRCLKDWAKDGEVCAAVARSLRLTERVRRNADQQLIAESAADDIDRKRARGEMNAVGACGAGDVGAVVDEQLRRTMARESCGLCGQLKESPGGKIFFAELN